MIFFFFWSLDHVTFSVKQTVCLLSFNPVKKKNTNTTTDMGTFLYRGLSERRGLQGFVNVECSSEYVF